MRKKTVDQAAVWSHETIEIIKSAFVNGKRVKSNAELAELTGKNIGSVKGIISRLGLNKGLPSAVQKKPTSAGVTFLELDSKQCRAIVSQDHLDVTFCGHPVVPGCSYCELHKKLFLQPARPLLKTKEKRPS